MAKSGTFDRVNNLAIIGMAGKFPGSDSIKQFWANLYDAKSSINVSTRWKDAQYYGGFLKDIEYFDADFFNVSPKEAKLMDPQQKHLLEISWQTFLDAGYSKGELEKKKVGVFTTSLPGDYKYRLKNMLTHNYFSFLGNSASVNAGRISYFYDFKGPAIHLDTACSSSLVCIDTAINNIQNGNCNLAFVGASTIFSTPEIFKLIESAQIGSIKGKCFTFDEDADGFVPSEAVGGILICKEDYAIKNNKHIYATIEHSQVNHNGQTNGIMSPSISEQRDLLINFYSHCNINTSELGYLEVHGTGTKIGDLMEINALNEAFSYINPTHKLNIGSCKTNIGHTLVSSGLVSLIKGLLIFEKGVIPKHINFKKLNKDIDLGQLNIILENTSWDPLKKYLAISAFGFSGTNAHLLLKRSNKVRGVDIDSYPFERKRHWVDIIGEASSSEYYQIEEDEEKRIGLKVDSRDQQDVDMISRNVSPEYMVKYLKEKISSLLSYDFQSIDINKRFEDFGMDSLVAMELVKSLKDFDKNISIVKIFKYNTIYLLSQYLFEKNIGKNVLDDRVNSVKTDNSKPSLEWIVLGDGEKPLLLLSPLNSSSKIWIQQIRFFLRGDYKIYIPSYPGHGKSSFDFYSIFKIAEIILDDFKQFIGDQNFITIGWSIGGCVGAIIAYLSKSQVSKLILVNSAPKFEDDIFSNSNLLRSEILNDEYFIRNVFKNSDNQHNIDNQNVIDIISENCPLDYLGHYYQELESFDILKLLSTIISQTLILCGKKDPILNFEDSKAFCLIPNSKMISLESGHFIPLTKAYLFNSLILKFLEA